MGYGAKLRFKDEVAVGVGLDHPGFKLNPYEVKHRYSSPRINSAQKT